jgi:hypothetical protein
MNLIEIYRFLGLANFYCRFVLGFFHISWPLSQVTKGGAKYEFTWTELQHKAFKDLKHRLCSVSFFTLSNLQQCFEIETNALDYAIDVVLTYHGHPMAYQSEILSNAVHSFPTYENDMCSIM